MRGNFAAPTDPEEIGAILRAIHASSIALPVVSIACKLHPLVAVHPGELERARWKDFNLEAKEWKFVPPKTIKRAGEAHRAPLSRQALTLLEEIKKISFGSLNGSSLDV